MYLKHSDLSKYWVLDIEANGLYPTQIWCAVAVNAATKQKLRMVGHAEVRRFLNEAPLDTIFVGHNLLSYDIPNCNRLLGTAIPVRRCLDTLVCSYLYNPRLQDGHSLGAWAVRLKTEVQKSEFSDFGVYSEALLTRCEQDVDINHELFLQLTAKMRRIGYSEESCEIEHQIRHIVNQQQRNGFRFDIDGAATLLGELRGREQSLGDSVKELFPPELQLIRSYSKSHKTDGQPTANYLRHCGAYPEVRLTDDGGYEAWGFVEFNLGSPAQRVQKLLELGWTPTKFTKKGSPQVDEESLVEASKELGKKELQALADWMVVNGRANMVNTWLEAVNRDDSCIHGTVFTCGASSRRMTHNHPNTANIPSNEAKYGEECRRLWMARPGRVLLGYDAKGIQMRLFGHFCDMYRRHPDVYETYLGDPHTGNAEAIGHGETRRNAKNHFYAFIFGAQPPKLGKMVGKDAAFGQYVTRKLFERAPGLEQATNEARDEYRSNEGRLRTIDGGFVICPGEHSCFNYKVQPAEACIMKKGAILLDKEARRQGLDYLKVGDIHDEAQLDVHDVPTAEVLGRIADRCITHAGEHFNLTVPMGGSYKIGRTWAETH